MTNDISLEKRRETDKAVLAAIGMITDKTDYDSLDHLRYILKTVSKSADFQRSVYGKRYIAKITKRVQRLSGQQTSSVNELIRQSDEKTEGFFRDMDDILFTLASQQTTRTTQRLVWVTLALTLFNTIVLLFVMLFLWRMNMGL